MFHRVATPIASNDYVAFRDENVVGAEAPLLAPGLVPNSIFDWNYTTTAQAGYNGRSIAYPRGRMLGGSSSVRA